MYSIENTIRLFEVIARHSSSIIKADKFYTAVITPNYTWPNSVFLHGSILKNLDDNLELLLLKMRQKKLPKFIRVQPGGSPLLLKALENKALRSGVWTAMSMRLNGLITTTQPAKIITINDSNQIDRWITILQVELMKGGELDKNLFKNLLKVKGVQLFGAYIDGVLESTALTFVENGVVGIYLIATTTENRGKGIGKQITAFALNEAFKNGCHTAHLQSTAIGKSVYESLGFQIQGEINGFLMYEV